MREIVFHNVLYVYTSKCAACITNVISKFFVFFLLLGWTILPNMSDLKGPESREGAFRLRRKVIYSAHGNWFILGPEKVDILPSVQDVVTFVDFQVTEQLYISRNSHIFSTEIKGKFVTIGPKEEGGNCARLQVLELASKRSMQRTRNKFVQISGKETSRLIQVGRSRLNKEDNIKTRF